MVVGSCGAVHQSSNTTALRGLFDEFYSNRDWPLASAVAIILLLLLVVPIVLLQRAQASNKEQVA